MRLHPFSQKTSIFSELYWVSKIIPAIVTPLTSATSIAASLFVLLCIIITNPRPKTIVLILFTCFGSSA